MFFKLTGNRSMQAPFPINKWAKFCIVVYYRVAFDKIIDFAEYWIPLLFYCLLGYAIRWLLPKSQSQLLRKGCLTDIQRIWLTIFVYDLYPAFNIELWLDLVKSGGYNSASFSSLAWILDIRKGMKNGSLGENYTNRRRGATILATSHTQDTQLWRV